MGRWRLLFVTYLQVYIFISAKGLTLPLKTVTKCESYTKKSPKPISECKSTDNLALENLKSTELPNTSSGIPIMYSNAASCNFAPVIPKNASVFTSSCTKALLSSEIPTSSLESNSFASLPSFRSLYSQPPRPIASLPSPNLLSADYTAYFERAGPQKPIAQSSPLFLNPYQGTPQNPNIASANGPPTLSPNVKSPFTAVSLNPISESLNINLGVTNPSLFASGNCETPNLPTNNQIPITLEKNPSSPTSFGYSKLEPSVLPTPGSNNLPLSQTSLPNPTSQISPGIALNNSPFTQSSCVPNNAQLFSNVVFDNILPSQTNLPNAGTMIPQTALNIDSFNSATGVPSSTSSSYQNPNQVNIANSNRITPIPQFTGDAILNSMPSCLPNLNNPNIAVPVCMNPATNLLNEASPNTALPPGSALTANLSPTPGISCMYDTTSSISIPNQPNGPMSSNADLGFNCNPNQIKCSLDKKSSGLSIIPNLHDAIIYPTVQTFPPPTCALPVTNPLPILDQTLLSADSTISSTSPLPPMHKPINEYFKGVKAATAKLNNFISSFSNRFGLKSFSCMQPPLAFPSQIPSQSFITQQCAEDKIGSTPQYSSIPQQTFYSPSQISSDLYSTDKLDQSKQPLDSTSYSAIKETILTETAAIPSITSSCEITKPQVTCDTTTTINLIDLVSPNTLISSPMSIASQVFADPLSPPSISVPSTPLPFKAPTIPKTIISSFNYPICSTSQYNSIKDTLASLTSNNYSPISLNGSPCSTSSNPTPVYPFEKFLFKNLPDVKPLSCFSANSCFKSSLPTIACPSLKPPSVPNPIIKTRDDVTSILIPDILSNLIPKTGSLDSCKKAFPFLSSISINTSPDINSIDCSTALSNMDECAIDVNSLPNLDFLDQFSPNLHECEINDCCKNLENIIAMLETSLNLNGGIDLDLDAVPDILSTLC